MTTEKIHQYLKEEKKNFTSPFDYLIEDSQNIPDESKEPHLTNKEKKLEQELASLPEDEKENLRKDKAQHYGQECIIDLNEVPLEMFNSAALKKFGEQLTEKIGMSLGPAHSWGDDHSLGMYKPDAKEDDKKDGISHVQFLWESSILIHALDELQKVFINVFSCKDFDANIVRDFSIEFFGGKLVNEHNIIRK